eukprot:TRINITY_DN4644_c0_g1_i1.p1 TRINITY_DN4644_c0_g1~~TRINITY_DN4644_c0_g1_i1.p1  ORF type:complete len:878 (-),score=63.81 TRINITY_DN4644_c0_g1_i1:1361-3994(-)
MPAPCSPLLSCGTLLPQSGGRTPCSAVTSVSPSCSLPRGTILLNNSTACNSPIKTNSFSLRAIVVPAEARCSSGFFHFHCISTSNDLPLCNRVDLFSLQPQTGLLVRHRRSLDLSSCASIGVSSDLFRVTLASSSLHHLQADQICVGVVQTRTRLCHRAQISSLVRQSKFSETKVNSFRKTSVALPLRVATPLYLSPSLKQNIRAVPLRKREQKGYPRCSAFKELVAVHRSGPSAGALPHSRFVSCPGVAFSGKSNFSKSHFRALPSRGNCFRASCISSRRPSPVSSNVFITGGTSSKQIVDKFGPWSLGLRRVRNWKSRSLLPFAMQSADSFLPSIGQSELFGSPLSSSVCSAEPCVSAPAQIRSSATVCSGAVNSGHASFGAVSSGTVTAASAQRVEVDTTPAGEAINWSTPSTMSSSVPSMVTHRHLFSTSVPAEEPLSPTAEVCPKNSICVTSKELEDVNGLAQWLADRLPAGASVLQSWGATPSTKRLANLWTELLEGEISLEDLHPPRRNVHVASVKIRNKKGQILVESHQEMGNGAIRPRNRPLSEKMKPGEDVCSACLRGIREELGPELGSSEKVTLYPLSYVREEEERVSFSYPGLLSRYVVHTMYAEVAGLPDETFSTTENEQGSEDAADMASVPGSLEVLTNGTVASGRPAEECRIVEHEEQVIPGGGVAGDQDQGEQGEGGGVERREGLGRGNDREGRGVATFAAAGLVLSQNGMRKAGDGAEELGNGAAVSRASEVPFEEALLKEGLSEEAVKSVQCPEEASEEVPEKSLREVLLCSSSFGDKGGGGEDEVKGMGDVFGNGRPSSDKQMLVDKPHTENGSLREAVATGHKFQAGVVGVKKHFWVWRTEPQVVCGEAATTTEGLP